MSQTESKLTEGSGSKFNKVTKKNEKFLGSPPN